MAIHGFKGRVQRVYEDGPTLSNSNVQTSLLPPSGKEFTLGAGELVLGDVIRFKYSGRISTVVTTPGTLTLTYRLGSVDIFSSGAIPLNVTAQTNVHWTFQGELMVSAVGPSTTTTFFPLACTFQSRAVVGSAAAGSGGVGTELLPYNTAPAVGAGCDITSSLPADLMATFSIANASNSITLHRGASDIYVK